MLEPVPPGRTADHIQLFARTGTGLVSWRLLSGNNRELGRGLEGFGDAEECRLAVKQLQLEMTSLETRLHRTRPNQWAWEVRRDQQPVVTSGHSFDRMIRCQRALAQFLERMAEAPISGSVMISDARRWARDGV